MSPITSNNFETQSLGVVGEGSGKERGIGRGVGEYIFVLVGTSIGQMDLDS